MSYSFHCRLRRDYTLYAPIFLPMDNPEVSLDLEIQKFLQQIRELPLPQLELLAAEFLPEDSLPSTYINSLGQRHKTISLRASLLVHIVSKYRIVPRQYQLSKLIHMLSAYVRKSVATSSSTSTRLVIRLPAISNSNKCGKHIAAGRLCQAHPLGELVKDKISMNLERDSSHLDNNCKS
ncbi:hypothetical protein B0H11DRAFT_1920885 [Mycena galericulata]|nr:hypothetical protein B0H11DRAFT_1920885 [Mycena galericulata]